MPASVFIICGAALDNELPYLSVCVIISLSIGGEGEEVDSRIYLDMSCRNH
jgi:hypothetical protein